MYKKSQLKSLDICTIEREPLRDRQDLNKKRVGEWPEIKMRGYPHCWLSGQCAIKAKEG